MTKQLTDWEHRELERLYEDAYEAESGMDARHALLIQFLYNHGYSVTNVAEALSVAERVLWGNYR